MKPSDRSLDIAVVGLGQGGGNLAAEFGRRGYRAIALNTANTDLNALGTDAYATLPDAQRMYIGLDGYDGAGADLNYGRQCVAESAERVREVVARHTEDADVVLLTAGLGGGTGSAISELCQALAPLDLPLTTLATLPAAHESSIAKVNAVRAVSELVRMREQGLIFADNGRLAELHGDVALELYFNRVNQMIIDPIDSINRLNQRAELQSVRSLDGEDLRTLLLSAGVLTCCEGRTDSLSVDSVMRWIKSALAQSDVMPAGFDLSSMAYIGLVLEAPSHLLEATPFSFFNQIGEQLKTSSGGAGIYTGIYRNTSMGPSDSARLRLLASTPELPEAISRIVGEAQREGGALREKLERDVGGLELGSLDEMELLPVRGKTGPGAVGRRRRRAKPTSAHEQELSDLGLFDVEGSSSGQAVAAISPPPLPPIAPDSQPVQRVSEVVPAPGRVASSEPASMETMVPPPGGEDGEDEVELSPEDSEPADALRPVPEGDDTFELPFQADSAPPAEPEAYDQLVDSFIQTDSDTTRRAIAYRLHVSRNSDHPLARFYANRAVERLVEAGRREELDAAMSQLSAE